MDDLAIGRLIMLARQRRQWRQRDLAAAAGVSRALVALAETGKIERLTVRSLRRIGAPLEMRFPFAPLWNGGEVDWLRDRDHARLVEQITAVLRHRWEVIVNAPSATMASAARSTSWHGTPPLRRCSSSR